VSEWGAVAGFFENGNEIQYFTKGGGFLEEQNDSQLLKEAFIFLEHFVTSINW
jgi:hypothetical protein